MNKNTYLSIVIPTYNRADFLDYSLEIHIPIVQEYGIEICIFDNASTDNTCEIVSKWMKEYPFLSYQKNETNIGPDANFERALRYPESNYIWLLSDTYQISEDGINKLLYTIDNSEKDFDIIVFNLLNKINISSKNYQNKNELLSELGAIMTCAAINVYNKKLIENVDFSRYYNSNFIQTGIIFEYISNKEFLLYWLGDYSVSSLNHPKLKKTNWSHTSKVFEIGCEDWTNFVMSLPPSYKLENKIKCIMDFGKVSGLFTFRNLILLRIKGLLNTKIFNKYKKLFPFTIDYPLYLVYVIAVMPKFIFKMIATMHILIFKRNDINKLKSIWSD